MKIVNVVTAVLVVVGALNWGLVAVARVDLVAALFGLSFGQVSAVTALVYGLVGVAGIYQALTWTRASSRVTPKGMVTYTTLAVLLSGAAFTQVRAQKPGDIVQTAVAAGSFKTLAKALAAADLVGTLQGPGPFTVFAPTDDAFAKLPAGTLENLLKPENKAMLVRVLTYHVVPGKVMAADAAKIDSAKAVSGDALRIKVKGGDALVNSARIVKTDVAASNGVIHVIDSVLLPPSK